MNLLKAFRLAHLYVGVFIAPAVLFFALSGALQTFGLHETNHDHPNYTPAKWIVLLAQIHKKQTPILPTKRPQQAPKPAADKSSDTAAPTTAGTDHPRHAHADTNPETQAPASPAAVPTSSEAPKPAKPAPDQAPGHNPVPLRIFFLIVALGLITSTVTGLTMAYKYNRNKLLVTLTLLAGAILPLLLLLA
jgi:hypothetical protein